MEFLLSNLQHPWTTVVSAIFGTSPNPLVMIETREIIIKAIIWNIWLEKNKRIFHDSCYDYYVVISKIIHMVLSWIDAALYAKKALLEESVVSAKRNMEFLRQHIDIVSSEEWLREVGVSSVVAFIYMLLFPRVWVPQSIFFCFF